MHPPRLTIRFAAAVALAVILPAGCRRDSGPTPAATAKAFNVLLITIDTLRADHLGCYGHPVIRTPNIDRLAREGVMFTQCTTSAPITLPSHCSILLGTEPYVHGVRVNGAYPLGEANTTLAEVLRDQGYRTGARVGAYVLHERWGLNQGFEDYESVDIPEPPGLVPDQGGGIAAMTRRDIFAERRADEVRKSAVRWLQARGDRKFFLWVHFFDPHKGYEPPEPYRTAYLNPYLGEIAFTDEQVGHLIDSLQGLGLADNTLVVLVADHGEGLGEHGEQTHLCFLYDTTLRVPLIFWYPGRIPAGATVDAQVRTIDIVPTVLAMVGLPPKEDAQGISLLPLMHDQADDPGLVAYAETFSAHFSLGLSQARSIRTGGWKYIHLPEPELYHVARDPGELENLAGREPRRLQDMRDQLHTLLAEAPPLTPITPPDVELSDHDVRRLAALGYVSISPEAAAEPSHDELAFFEPRGNDPKHYTEQIELFARGIGAVQAHEYALAEEIFGQLIEDGLETANIVRWYVEALTEQDKLDKAIAVLDRAVQNDPDFAEGYNDCGLLLHRQGRDAEAAQRYREAVRLAPKVPFFRINLGNALVATGRPDEAAEQFNHVLEQDAKNADAFNGMGNVFALQGEYDQATRMYRQAISLEPERALFHGMLGRVLLAQGKVEDGIECLRRAVKVDPDYADGYLLLAGAFYEHDRVDDAIDVYRQMLRRDPRKAPVAERMALVLARQHDYRRAVMLFSDMVELAPGYWPGANNLAWLLATAPQDDLRDGPRAVRLAEALVMQTQRKHPGTLDTLAAAYAETGQFDKAVATAEEAIGLMPADAGAEEAGRMKARLALYRQQKPHREPVAGAATGSGG